MLQLGEKYVSNLMNPNVVKIIELNIISFNVDELHISTKRIDSNSNSAEIIIS